MTFDSCIQFASRAVEGAGVCVLLFGALIAIGIFLKRCLRKTDFDFAYHRLRADLGRAILLGLELLVIADIIETVGVEPSLESLSMLAVIVLIRTLLSFTLELEVSGRWPWQQDKKKGDVA